MHTVHTKQWNNNSEQKKTVQLRTMTSLTQPEKHICIFLTLIFLLYLRIFLILQDWHVIFMTVLKKKVQKLNITVSESEDVVAKLIKGKEHVY